MYKLSPIANFVRPVTLARTIFGRLDARGFLIPFVTAADTGDNNSVPGVIVGNKPANGGVFLSVANGAKNLNIASLKSHGFVNATRDNVMSMKMLIATAFLASSNFINNLCKKIIFSMRAPSNAAFPMRMIFSGMAFAKTYALAFSGAIFGYTSIAFSSAKGFVTFFACMLNNCFRFLVFSDISADRGTKQTRTFIPHPAFKKIKFLIANLASPKNFSGSMFCHAI